MGKNHKQQEVIVYSDNGCGACLTMVNTLRQSGVDVEERNISVNQEWADEFRKLDVMSVPATVVNGELRALGFDHELVAELSSK